MGKVTTKKKVKKKKVKPLHKTSVNTTKPMPAKRMREIRNGIYPKEWRYLNPDWFNNGGRPKDFETPEVLARAAEDYFNWCNDNPWYSPEWKDGKYQKKSLGRPFTWGGLAVRLGVSEQYIAVFKTQLKKEDPYYEQFIKVIAAIDSVIKTQKFEGAAVGVFNSNLIAYDLGLKKDVPMMMGGATALSITVVGEQQNKTLDEVKQMLEAIDVEHEEVQQQKLLNGKNLNGNGNGKH